MGMSEAIRILKDIEKTLRRIAIELVKMNKRAERKDEQEGGAERGGTVRNSGVQYRKSGHPGELSEGNEVDGSGSSYGVQHM